MSEENQDINNEQDTQETQDTEPHFLERDGEKLEITENFWDKDKKEPDVFAILKAATDLRKQVSEDNSPENGVYAINIPKEFQDKLEANPDDPLYKDFCAFAKKHRVSQEAFDEITHAYYKMIYDGIKNSESEEDTFYSQEADKLKEKFGNRIDKIKTRIDNFMANSGITDPDILNELAFMLTSVGGISTLDYLLGLRGEPMPDINGTSRAGVLSLEELRAMQADPRYLTDKAFQKRVEEGYKALYPG